jgi:ABC-type dipeptide/oligopeptide/nickel transport system permease component
MSPPEIVYCLVWVYAFIAIPCGIIAAFTDPRKLDARSLLIWGVLWGIFIVWFVLAATLAIQTGRWPNGT